MTKRPTVHELEDQIKLGKVCETERSISDKKYARKEVEKILIWVGTIFGTAILIAIANQVLK
jgi:hypothetical protein